MQRLTKLRSHMKFIPKLYRKQQMLTFCRHIANHLEVEKVVTDSCETEACVILIIKQVFQVLRHLIQNMQVPDLLVPGCNLNQDILKITRFICVFFYSIVPHTSPCTSSTHFISTDQLILTNLSSRFFQVLFLPF